jgi:hypothetical protein
MSLGRAGGLCDCFSRAEAGGDTGRDGVERCGSCCFSRLAGVLN